MKLATLLIPAYLPRSYDGATPAPYQSGTVDQFEKGLAAIAPGFVRHPNATRVTESPRWAIPWIVTPYQFMIDPEKTTLGDAIALALKAFKLDKINVTVVEAESEDFTADMAADLQTGIYLWGADVK